jgi:CBS domain containing-hemolysin-like protein
MRKICVIDGQGGGIGATIIKKIKEHYSENVEIIALGTNAIATAQMLKARANKGASGENAIVHTVQYVDVIIGTISIVLAHSMMGEMTPKMTEAIASSRAKKIIIPITQENIEVVGVPLIPLPRLVEKLINDYLPEL